MNRRALLGLGALGISAATTAGIIGLRGRGPGGLDGAVSPTLTNFVDDPRTLAALSEAGVTLARPKPVALADALQLSLGDELPAYLWLADVDAAKDLQRANRSMQTVFTSPLVLFARGEPLAGLRASGAILPEAGQLFGDSRLLMGAVADGSILLAVNPPVQSDSAFLWAGLAVSLLGPDSPVLPALFNKTSQDTFDDFMASDPAAQPLRIGLEAELFAWIAADSGRWPQLQASRSDAAPATVYLRPTLYAAFTLLALEQTADALVTAVLSPALQNLGRLQHGLRGPQGQSGAGETFQAAARLPPRPTAVVEMPDATTMRAIVAQLSR